MAGIDVVSTIPGRLRVRSPRLRARGLGERAVADLRAQPGVTDVQVKSGAGSLVVLFDAQAADAEALELRIDALLARGHDKTDRGPVQTLRRSGTLNRVTKAGMMGTLGASVAYGALGRKKPHIAFGVGFLAFAGLHMARYANRLIR